MSERSAKRARIRNEAVCTLSRLGYQNGCRCEECTAGATREGRLARERWLAMEIWKDPAHEKHGTATGYTSYGCRCDRCSGARKAQVARRYAKGLSPGDRRHGTAAAYEGWGCRCEKCREAEARKLRAYNERSSS